MGGIAIFRHHICEAAKLLYERLLFFLIPPKTVGGSDVTEDMKRFSEGAISLPDLMTLESLLEQVES